MNACDVSRDGHSSVSTQTESCVQSTAYRISACVCMCACVSRCTVLVGRRHGVRGMGHGTPIVNRWMSTVDLGPFDAWMVHSLLYSWRFTTVVRHGLSVSGIFCTTIHIIKLLGERYYVTSPSVCRLSVCLSVRPSVCLSVCLSICLSVCLSSVCLWRSCIQCIVLNFQTIFLQLLIALSTRAVVLKHCRKSQRGF